MATFSPSPAPRRSSRLQTRGNSPTRRPNRSAQTPQFVNDAMSVVSGMDLDERGSALTDRSYSRAGSELVFAKTGEMTTSFYANLPLEVKQVLRTSDFNKDFYSGEIDTDTGFALVASAQTCFVWQHAQALKGLPTCYIFSCPQDTRPPFHALVPQGPREPGLILVSTLGQIRFWDSIGIGLAGGDNFVASQLEDLDYQEEVTNFVRVDAQTYILSTSFGRLYRVVLTSTGGKYHLTFRSFARPSSNTPFSRLFPSIWSPATPSVYQSKDKSCHIHAVTIGTRSALGERNVWVLANGHIQQWSMKTEGWEDFVTTYNLLELLAPLIQSTFKVSTQDLEFSDIALSNDGNLAVLISYTGEEYIHGFRRFYALAELNHGVTGLQVQNLKRVPYQTTNQPGPPVHPRIQLIFSGSITSIQFGDAVVICARDSEYRDRVELKSITDRTLGLGVNSSTNHLLILTANTMMKVALDLDKIQAFNPDTGRADLTKSIMMQAILYGALPMNPLRFSFPPDMSEDALMEGAEQLSDAVLKSDPEVVRQNPDLTSQMTGRKERLSWLIGFINENSVLEKMAQQSRQKLATDAEKLYAAHQLWLSYNKYLSSSPSTSVLKDTIQVYMQEIGDASHEDVVRAFFRSHIPGIGKLLKVMVEIVKTSSQTEGNTCQLLSEANRIITTVLTSAFQYRAYNLGVYGIDSPMLMAWTSGPAVIDNILALFDLTTSFLETSSAPSASKRDREPGIQLPDLAAVFFDSMKERLEWLSSLGKDAQQETNQLQQRFAQLRPEILETLSRCGFQDAAYDLAERHQDFASLVALSHKDAVFSPNQNPNAARIQSYIQRFKDDFTTELFQWYIQHGEIRIMFDQEDTLGGYIEIFFREHPNLGVSWIHDLNRQKYGSAATSLLMNAEQATNLEGKHLMLSIGKLACLAQTQESNSAVDEKILDAFHDDLDFVSVHESLLEELRSTLPPARTRQPLDNQVDLIFKATAKGCTDRKAFSHIFKDFVRRLLQGKALSVEDMVDLLTLKDNSSMEDYATSLHLLSCAESMPEARKSSAIRSVWRRVYLHDDWETLQKTAGVSDAILNQRYQGTALHATLCSVLRRDEPVIAPDAALMPPSTEEIVSRWPGMSTDQVNALVDDYNSEQDRLGELDLGEIFNQIRELALNVVEWEDEQ